MHERLEKIKAHVKDHKTTYIACGVGAVATGVTVYVVMRHKIANVEFASPITNKISIPGDNNVTTIYNTIMQSVGNSDNPSIPIFDQSTNTAYRSITHAAAALGLNARDISWHLKGNLDEVKGHVFIPLLPEIA